ncbi:hypothetical protein NHF45_02855 [Maricaulaceae bacterium NA33B04]|nr:hypothetical protein [Maricaulaceae bacterium NA33B04]
MAMDNGLYLAKFRTPLDDASGVVIIVDGNTAYGGDSGMYYFGEISGTEDRLTVTLRVRRHDESTFSVFGDFDDFTLSLKGKKKGSGFYFEGRASEAPSMRFEAELKPAPK